MTLSDVIRSFFAHLQELQYVDIGRAAARRSEFLASLLPPACHLQSEHHRPAAASRVAAPEACTHILILIHIARHAPTCPRARRLTADAAAPLNHTRRLLV